MSGLVIIGGSYAGLNIATAARQHGYAEPIVMLTDEHDLPYHRPPLSKGFLTGANTADSLPIKGEKFYSDHGIDVVFGARVERIDPTGRVASTQGDFAFDRLALATGTRARRIPIAGHDLDGVVTLRSLADAQDILARLDGIEAVAIVGGGFIGLELAASFAKAGLAVTVLEGAGRVMARAVGETVSTFVGERFRKEGVALLCGTGLDAILGKGGKATGVRDGHGRVHPAQLVVMAVGAVPNAELAMPLGLADGQGIHVNAEGRTTDPRIFAAGDCAFGPNPHAGRSVRLESVQNATDQAKAAGAAIAGAACPNEAVPWFWSDQFDLKLQMVGLPNGATREVIRGSVEEGRFSVFHMAGDRVVGIESVNAVADHVFGRKLLRVDHALSDAVIADVSVKLKDVVRV